MVPGAIEGVFIKRWLFVGKLINELPRPTNAARWNSHLGRAVPRFHSRVLYARTQELPHVEDVPGHTGILIHWGNWAKDTEDCLLVGRTEAVDFIGHSVEEFDVLFAKIQAALREGPQRITYLDPKPAVDRA